MSGGAVRIRRALVTAWRKDGLAELGGALAEHDVEIVASGGTAEALREAGISPVGVEKVTGTPEMLGGRVKTLHPAIHAAILARRDREDDAADLEAHGIEPIDLVVVDLYPFEEGEALGADDEAAKTELIDIGGVALVRAAAKNRRDVAVIVDPADYDALIEEMAESAGAVSAATRDRLAAKAMRRTAAYDATIAAWLSEDEADWPERRTWTGELTAELRYGENPHQPAALYREGPPRPGDLTAVEILQGKALSYNNYIDAEAARRVARDLHALDPEAVHCAIVKHTIPCGAASASTARDAYERALAADPVSAFGGIVALTAPVDGELGEVLTEHFLEVVWAPGFDETAREALSRKANLRVLSGPLPGFDPAATELRRVAGGLLVQRPNLSWLPEGDPRETLEVPTGARPTDAQWADLLFAWTVCRAVASNAIVLAGDRVTIGVGGGQTNRVGAAEIAIGFARELGHRTEGSVLASDGFFPFADSVEKAAAAGIAAIVQPGGSRRDPEVVEAADRLGIPMVFTGSRQFRH